MERRNGIVIPCVAGVKETFRRIFFSKYNTPVHLKPKNTVKQKLVHPKDKTPWQKLSNVVYAVQCSEDCNYLYIGETKQPLHRHMAQYRRASSSGQDSAVHLHLKGTGHFFEDHNVHILDREDRWFERGVKEAIFVKRWRIMFPAIFNLQCCFKILTHTLTQALGHTRNSWAV